MGRQMSKPTNDPGDFDPVPEDLVEKIQEALHKKLDKEDDD